ncbi:hypothetical protein [Lactococcus lactis]|uniref:hypothetical protein n=1 Tax=Lactococcus lactis TaxID=1358 RepID=UPI0006BB448C|nr:hypothetical protein [Lactococcus lactis]OJH48056.1 hypothetical protein LGL2_01495 [Lactococcus lactis subsp. lactis bv. diacetylactis]
MENKSYEKIILWSATFLSLFALAACSNSKSSENKTKKENTSSSKVTSSSKTSNGKNSATHSTNTSPSSSQANTNNSEKVQKSSSPLSGYSAEQVEYARVTETLLVIINMIINLFLSVLLKMELITKSFLFPVL